MFGLHKEMKNNIDRQKEITAEKIVQFNKTLHVLDIVSATLEEMDKRDAELSEKK